MTILVVAGQSLIVESQQSYLPPRVMSEHEIIMDAIKVANNLYPAVSTETLLAIAKCESGIKHTGVWGDSGDAYGLFQFHLPTFKGFCEGSRESIYDQALCTAKMISNGKQNHWTCWHKIPKNLQVVEKNES